MKNIMKRLLVTVLALVMLGTIALPTAMAAEKDVVVANASASVYAGMKDKLVVYRNGVAQNPSLFRWRSSNSNVVSVSSNGTITGKKGGYSATITATRKSTGAYTSIRVTVKRNKVNNINAKPAATQAAYQHGGISLKSVEIVSPSKVVVEYYVAFNFPSSWKASKITAVSDAINLYNKSTGSFYKTIVGGYYQTQSTRISGFRARYGRSVQTIKVTYSGSQVSCANIRLAKYFVYNSTNVKFAYKYYK